MNIELKVPTMVKYEDVEYGKIYITPLVPHALFIKPNGHIVENMVCDKDKNDLKEYMISLDGEWYGFQVDSVYILVEQHQGITNEE